MLGGTVPVRGGDPFSQLNRVLDSPLNVAGSIRKACGAVEECLVKHR